MVRVIHVDGWRGVVCRKCCSSTQQGIQQWLRHEKVRPPAPTVEEESKCTDLPQSAFTRASSRQSVRQPGDVSKKSATACLPNRLECLPPPPVQFFFLSWKKRHGRVGSQLSFFPHVIKSPLTKKKVSHAARVRMHTGRKKTKLPTEATADTSDRVSSPCFGAVGVVQTLIFPLHEPALHQTITTWYIAVNFLRLIYILG